MIERAGNSDRQEGELATEVPMLSPQKQKDRRGAVSPKSDQVFRSGGSYSGILILATICTKPPGGMGCLTASHSEVRTAGGLLSSVRMLSA